MTPSQHQDFLSAYHQRLQEQLAQRELAREAAAKYQADLLDRALTHNKAAAARRLAETVVTPKAPGVAKLKEQFAYWVTHAPEDELNRPWKLADLRVLFGGPHTRVLAHVIKGFGWHRVEVTRCIGGVHIHRREWFPPKVRQEASRPRVEESLTDAIAALPKEPIKLRDIQQQFRGKFPGVAPRPEAITDIMVSLGWSRWRDNTGRSWWLGPDTPIPVLPKRKCGRKQILEKKPPRPRGRPRKHPTTEQPS